MMMMENVFYRCNKPFIVPMYDDDGYLDENENVYVRQGSVWEKTWEDKEVLKMVHLEDRATGDWLEISVDRLRECFSPKDDGDGDCQKN